LERIKEMQKNLVPLPPELLSLPILTANPWLQIDTDTGVNLEGPSFDREGNLFVTSVRHGKVFKITPEKQIALIFENKAVKVDGSAIHRDGRLFIACLTGELVAMNTDGSHVVIMRPSLAGKPLAMNDLVFDSRGNLFVTDFIGNVSDPAGGLYYLSSQDYSSVRPILGNLWSPNGVSLSPDGRVIWVAETARNTVLRAEFLRDGLTFNPMAGVCYPFHSTGGPGGPDSNKVDEDGNLYQAIIFQGRIVVLNPFGIPIANVVVPGREKGNYLRTTNLAIKPGTKEGYICASGEGGAWIFKFEALSNGLKLFSHQ